MHASQLSCELLEVRNWLSCSSLDPGTDPPPDGTGGKREDDTKQRVHGLRYRCVMSVRAGIWRIWSLNLENLECHSQEGHFYPLSIRSITSRFPLLRVPLSLRVLTCAVPFTWNTLPLPSHWITPHCPPTDSQAPPRPQEALPTPPLDQLRRSCLITDCSHGLLHADVAETVRPREACPPDFLWAPRSRSGNTWP